MVNLPSKGEPYSSAPETFMQRHNRDNITEMYIEGVNRPRTFTKPTELYENHQGPTHSTPGVGNLHNLTMLDADGFQAAGQKMADNQAPNHKRLWQG